MRRPFAPAFLLTSFRRSSGCFIRLSGGGTHSKSKKQNASAMSLPFRQLGTRKHARMAPTRPRHPRTTSRWIPLTTSKPLPQKRRNLLKSGAGSRDTVSRHRECLCCTHRPASACTHPVKMWEGLLVNCMTQSHTNSLEEHERQYAVFEQKARAKERVTFSCVPWADKRLFNERLQRECPQQVLPASFSPPSLRPLHCPRVC